MFNNKFYTVYQITNLINSKIYVGVHVTDDLNDGYVGSGLLIQKAIEKYSIENFKKDYIAVFNNSKDMFNLEQEIVNENFLSRDDVYNLKEGGSGGWDYVNLTRTEEGRHTTAKIGRAAANDRGAHIKGSKKHNYLLKNDENYRYNFCQKIKEARKHQEMKPHTNDVKAKIGKANSFHQQGSKNNNYGTCWVYNETLKESKRIPKDELNQWLEHGWMKGRKIRFS